MQNKMLYNALQNWYTSYKEVNIKLKYMTLYVWVIF